MGVTGFKLTMLALGVTVSCCIGFFVAIFWWMFHEGPVFDAVLRDKRPRDLYERMLKRPYGDDFNQWYWSKHRDSFNQWWVWSAAVMSLLAAAIIL